MPHLDQISESRYRKVTAVEPLDDGRAFIWLRENGTVSRREIPFRPFLLLGAAELLDGCEAECAITTLAGSAPLAFLAEFPDRKSYAAAIAHLKRVTGRTPSAPGAPYLVVSDDDQQLFTANRFRLFRDMEFNDLLRMQFDIETLSSEGYEFSNPERAGDQIVIISMSDNTGWEKVIALEDDDEKALLEEFVRIVAERDPDVLEGHNICRFDLPYIETRAKRCKVALRLGRDGSAPKRRPSRFSAAERIVNYDRYDIFGRHLIDTLHLATFYDLSHRNLESYGLKSLARHFRIVPPQRTYIEGDRINAAWREDRERLLAYALDDVRETRALSAILSPSYFYQAQLIPMSYQNAVMRGNATRINAMLIAGYLAAGHSIPFPEPAVQFAGALTRAFHSGVFRDVWHCDVRSLYPSIILAAGWTPRRDELGLFPSLLHKLRRFRLEAKDAERAADKPAAKDYYNALQTTFKILINSFYGYLGFAQGNFNDYAMAERITSRGREILASMEQHLSAAGAVVIEMDTDGIYFQPPAGIAEPAEMEADIQAELPEGIEVELDAVYPAMFCYKSKNYALLNDNGEITVVGAALKSRGLEPFQRDYIRGYLSLLLNERSGETAALTEEYRTAIRERRWELARLAKSETLNDSVDNYRKKLAAGKTRRSAVYELVSNSKRDYRRGDQVSFYVTGEKARIPVVDNCRLLVDAPPVRDENIAYYLAKLDELSAKFREFLPGEAVAEEEADSGQMELEF